MPIHFIRAVFPHLQEFSALTFIVIYFYNYALVLHKIVIIFAAELSHPMRKG